MTRWITIVFLTACTVVLSVWVTFLYDGTIYVKPKPAVTSGVSGTENSGGDAQDFMTTVDTGVYAEFLLNKYDETVDDGVRFCIKDIDGDGLDDLIIEKYPTYLFFTYDNGVRSVGSLELRNGTTRLLECETYSGLVRFSVGGGLEHYNYITIKDGNVVDEEIWKYSFSKLEGYPESVEISTDKKLIEESKKAYEENKDLKFIPLSTILNLSGNVDYPINAGDAEKAVAQYADGQNTPFVSVGTSDINGRTYFVIKEYEDHPEASTTVGWYAVDAVNGKVYELDMTYDVLLEPGTPFCYREVLGEWYLLSKSLEDGSFLQTYEADMESLYYPTDDKNLKYKWFCMLADAVAIDEKSVGFGYVLMDMNGDKTDELFLVDGEHTVLAVFTKNENQAVLLDAYWLQYSCTVTESGALNTREWIGTGGSYRILKLDPDSSQLNTVLEFGEKVSEGYMVKGGKRVNISSSEYDELISQYPHEHCEQWMNTEIHTFG